MSYDVMLLCPTCHADATDCMSPTYNLTPIFDLALTGEPLPNPETGEIGVVLLGHATDRPRGLRVLSGTTGQASEARLRAALASLNDPAMAETYRALEPPNKWGTLETAVEVITKMLAAACKHPASVWDIG